MIISRKIRCYSRKREVLPGYQECVDTSHEEGRQEERIEMAKRGLAKGYSIEIIADMTGLSEEEIHQLQ